jgi:hypothetical protein
MRGKWITPMPFTAEEVEEIFGEDVAVLVRGTPARGTPYQDGDNNVSDDGLPPDFWASVYLRVRDALVEARGMFPTDSSMEKQVGGSHIIRRQKAAPGKSTCYGGYANSWTAEFNRQLHRQDLWGWYASLIRELYASGRELSYRTTPVEDATDAYVTSIGNQVRRYRKKSGDALAGYVRFDAPRGPVTGYNDVPHVVGTVIVTSAPLQGFSRFKDVQAALDYLAIVLSTTCPIHLAGYVSERNCYSHSLNWTPDLPRTENGKHEAIGRLPAEAGEDMATAFAMLQAAASKRDLVAFSGSDAEVDATDAARLFFKWHLEAPDGMDPGLGAWLVLDCWKAVGATLFDDAYYEWFVGKSKYHPLKGARLT